MRSGLQVSSASGWLVRSAWLTNNNTDLPLPTTFRNPVVRPPTATQSPHYCRRLYLETSHRVCITRVCCLPTSLFFGQLFCRVNIPSPRLRLTLPALRMRVAASADRNKGTRKGVCLMAARASPAATGQSLDRERIFASRACHRRC